MVMSGSYALGSTFRMYPEIGSGQVEVKAGSYSLDAPQYWNVRGEVIICQLQIAIEQCICVCMCVCALSETSMLFIQYNK